MQDIYNLESTRRYPIDSPDKPLATAETHELALTLTSRQKSLLASILNEAEASADLDLLRACLVHPRCFRADLRPANWVVSRYQDCKLYSKHTQGPDQPTEDVPEHVRDWFKNWL